MKYLLLGFILVLGYGCSTVTNMDKLLQVNALAENQAGQQKIVEQQNKKFEALLKVVKNNQLAQYSDKRSILKAFGEPIFMQTTKDGEIVTEKWMYRYSEKIMGSEKVYLYFDASGKLIDFKHVPLKVNETKPEVDDASAQKTEVPAGP